MPKKASQHDPWYAGLVTGWRLCTPYDVKRAEAVCAPQRAGYERVFVWSYQRRPFQRQKLRIGRGRRSLGFFSCCMLFSDYRFVPLPTPDALALVLSLCFPFCSLRDFHVYTP